MLRVCSPQRLITMSGYAYWRNASNYEPDVGRFDQQCLFRFIRGLFSISYCKKLSSQKITIMGAIASYLKRVYVGDDGHSTLHGTSASITAYEKRQLLPFSSLNPTVRFSGWNDGTIEFSFCPACGGFYQP